MKGDIMRKNFFNGLKRCRSRKGITLVEVVVALTIITVISGATVLLLSASVRSDARTLDSFYASAEAENAVECFRFADDGSELLRALDAVDPDYKQSETDGRIFVLRKNTYTVKITADFTYNTIEITVVDIYGDTIYSLDYKKG